MRDFQTKSDISSATNLTIAHQEGNVPQGWVTIPAYLKKVYWWAYIHPRAVRIFEQKWLINLILFGNYASLRDKAITEISDQTSEKTLQIACVYGDLTSRLHQKIAGNGSLDVVDVLPIQLKNLQEKLPANSGVSLWQCDSSALKFANASYDNVLLFFLLHEQPESVRRNTLAEACRVVKPGGKIIIVDYHQPSRWNPLRVPLKFLLKRLEPFADDLFKHEVTYFFPDSVTLTSRRQQLFFGGLYQKLVFIR